MITGRTDHHFPFAYLPLPYLRLRALTYLPTKSYPLGHLSPNGMSDLTDWLVRYCFACLAHTWPGLGWVVCRNISGPMISIPPRDHPGCSVLRSVLFL